jgi:ribonuclease HI
LPTPFFLLKAYAIFHGIILAKDMEFDTLVCYSDSFYCINLINGLNMRFQVHVVLIQDINKELLSHTNYTICHTLKEKNQCTNFLAKLGASSDVRHAWISSGWHARASRKQRNWNFFPS